MSNEEQAARLYPRRSQGSLIVSLLLGLALIGAGSIFELFQIPLFLWSGEWLSPVELLGTVRPSILETGWIAAPQTFIGVQKILTSPFFGVISVGAGIATAWLGATFLNA